jgi:hypothetical protein
MSSASSLTAVTRLADSSWRQQSVRLFFETMAWQGQPTVMPASSEPAALAPAMTLSVAHFFAAVPWDGPIVVAAPVVASAPAVPVTSTLTLEAFSDLF